MDKEVVAPGIDFDISQSLLTVYLDDDKNVQIARHNLPDWLVHAMLHEALDQFCGVWEEDVDEPG